MRAQSDGEQAAESRRLEETQRLRQIYETSTLLAQFDSVEHTVPAVFAIVARAVPLASALVMLEGEDGAVVSTPVWPSEDNGAWLAAAKTRATTLYAYLASARSLEPALSPASSAPRGSGRPTGSFVMLPLVTARGRIFGAVHVEGAALFDEMDLVFLNAVCNQLAVAIDRSRAADARLSTLHAQRIVAEGKQHVAEQAEKSVRAEVAFARAVTACLGEAVVAIDLEGRVTLFNPAAERLLAWTAREAFGKRVDDILQLRGPDGVLVAAESSPWTRAMLYGHSLRSEEYSIAARGRPPFPVSFTVEPLLSSGRVRGAVLAFRDIIDVKRTEKEQRLLAHVTASMLATLQYPDTVVEVVRASVPRLADLCLFDELNADGTIRRCAVAFADEHKQQALEERVMQAAPRRGALTPEVKVLESGQPLLWSDVNRRPSDSVWDERHADLLRAIGARSLMVVPLVARGNVVGALSFVTAESERRYSTRELALAEELAHRTTLAIENARLLQQAQRATSARDNLLSMVSHDLKNPLGVIGMSLDLLTFEGSDRRQSRSQLRVIRRAVLRMQRLIEDLLDTASIDAGQLSIEPKVIPVPPLVAEMLEMMQPAAADKGIQLQSEVPPHTPAIFADRARIQQVFANLLGNAIKFTPNAGSITVRVEHAERVVTFSITDTGPGIREADLPRLFDRFWQARITARMGTGLGLFIANGIVQAHGGRIWVESRLGVGSTFSFSVPAAGRA